MKPAIILFLMSIFFSPHVFAWTINANFEGGTIGAKAESPNPDAFGSTAGNSKYASSPAISGSQSASVYIEKGTNGFGMWGGGFTFPTLLKEGDTLWWRVKVYYPTGWDFSCGGCTEGVKFMRIHTQDKDGKNQGYQSTLINGGTTGGQIAASTEVHPSPFWINNGGRQDKKGTSIPRNQWVTYEFMVKFHSEENKGEYRLWQDGNLIFEDTITPTLISSTSTSGLVYLYTYWNKGAPRSQTSYVDDIVLTNEIPGERDAYGNPYIGVGQATSVARPKPPNMMTAR